jgi:hypothetical protein
MGINYHKGKMMLIEVQKVTPVRKLKALLDEDSGILYLRFMDPRLPDQKTAILNSPFAHEDRKNEVNLNGTGTLEMLNSSSLTEIYEGDTVTLKF